MSPLAASPLSVSPSLLVSLRPSPLAKSPLESLKIRNYILSLLHRNRFNSGFNLEFQNPVFIAFYIYRAVSIVNSVTLT